MTSSNKVMVPQDSGYEELKRKAIWITNPTRDDLNFPMNVAKAIFGLSVHLVFYLVLCQLGVPWMVSLIITVILTLISIMMFKDGFFALDALFQNPFKDIKMIDPFKDLLFWQETRRPDRLCISNKADASHVAISVFKMSIMAENVGPSILNTIRSLYIAGLSFSYQVAQSPVLAELGDGAQMDGERFQDINNADSFKIDIYLTVYFKVSGMILKGKLAALDDYVTWAKDTLQGQFHANFHHFQMELLKGTKLMNALRIITLKKDLPLEDNTKFAESSSASAFFYKAGYVTFMAFLLGSLLGMAGIPLEWAISIPVVAMILTIGLFWRGIFVQLFKLTLNKDQQLVEVNPFADMTFYSSKTFNGAIFIHSDNYCLTALKALQLNSVNNSFFIYPDKFVRQTMGALMSVSQTFLADPMSPAELDKQREYLKRKHYYLSLESDQERENWMLRKNGFFSTIMPLTLSVHEFSTSLSREDFRHLHGLIQAKFNSLVTMFETEFAGFKLKPVTGQLLLSAFKCMALKTHHLRLSGTHLKQVTFQGSVLSALLTVVDEYKKGIDTRIAAEFNTPLHLKSGVILGRAINTEYLGTEIPAGFKFNQLKQLLIANGTQDDRDNAVLTIVQGLIKAKKASIVFDFGGNYSKLIPYFQGSQYEGDILHFKLGINYTLSLLESDIPYDTNNSIYVDHVIDSMALCYKKSDRDIQSVRTFINNNAGLDWNTMTLQVQNETNYNRDWQVQMIHSFFNEIQQHLSHVLKKTPRTQEGEVCVQDLLKDERTVIIDCSTIPDQKAQLFAAMLILSKIMHQVNYGESNDYLCKYLIMPDTDAIFNEQYLDHYGTVNYAKVDKFLRPLRSKGFGLIFLANHVSYYHRNIFHYFDNFLTFKATDKRDIAALQSVMNLQELHGTGYYSRSRKTTYQIDYLKTMRKNEALMKRDDINQVFPVEMRMGKLANMRVPPMTEIQDHMVRQGHDVRHSQHTITVNAKETILEADLGCYFPYFPNGLDGLKNFLEDLKKLKLGNLYKQLIEGELLNLMYPQAKKTIKSKAQVKKLISEVFDTLVKKEYLVKSSRKSVSGSQPIRTSYEVGPHYDEAISDYFEVKRAKKVTAQTIEKESAGGNLGFKARMYEFMGDEKDNEEDNEENYEEDEESENQDQENRIPLNNDLSIAAILSQETGSFALNELYAVHYWITMGEEDKARSKCIQIIPRFLLHVYEKIHHLKPLENSLPNIKKAITHLSSEGVIPQTILEISRIIEDVAKTRDAKEMYQKVDTYIYDLETTVNGISTGEESYQTYLEEELYNELDDLEAQEKQEERLNEW